jgi:hypothetical protein
MAVVRKAAALLGLLALVGCPGASSRADKVPEELRRPRLVTPKVADRHPYGPVAQLKVGQWAKYREGARTLTLAAVAADGDRMWIEVIDEGDPRQVSARLVGPDGVVTKALYAEVSKDGQISAVEPQALEQDVAATPPRLAESGRETGEESVKVGGRELKAKKVAVRFEDLEGRLTQEVTLWHPDVPPIYAAGEGGGLVRRTVGSAAVELLDFGTDAKPIL